MRPSTWFALTGAAVALLPGDWLSVVTDTRWELEIIRLTGLVGITLSLIWPWAMGSRDAVSRRLILWVAAGVIALAVYAVSTGPFFLVAGFSVLFAGSLDLWAARAHVASQQLRERLEDRGHP